MFRRNSIILGLVAGIFIVMILSHRGSKNVLYDFDASLPQATVSLDYGGGKVQKAEWKDNKWAYPQSPFVGSEVEVRSVSFLGEMHRCIWAHPVQNATKIIQFENVPIGKSVKIFGGIADSGVKNPPGAPVFLTVQVEDLPVGSIEFKETDQTFNRIIDTHTLTGRKRWVTSQIQSPVYDWRHFCFSAQSVKK